MLWNLDIIIEYIKGTLLGHRQILTFESPLKMMKNAFYFTLTLFVLKIFKFLSSLFIRKVRLISKFMTSQPD